MWLSLVQQVEVADRGSVGFGAEKNLGSRCGYQSRCLLGLLVVEMELGTSGLLDLRPLGWWAIEGGEGFFANGGGAWEMWSFGANYEFEYCARLDVWLSNGVYEAYRSWSLGARCRRG